MLSLRSNTNTASEKERRASISILRVIFNADDGALKNTYIASFLEILRRYSEVGGYDYHVIKEIGKIIEKCQ